ncbi:capsid maturation protease [Mycobacterium phage Koko]|uniref:Capsid maturation protease n=4 Tax=Gladiatorvirus TaxID=2948726 RepID=V5R4J9_9CAUD|nr:capsid maturation protease [Mycobacterium phage Artemis2UCLA]YP_008859124.1 capsid maturation protease [Mycobacterium phage Zaka]YP_009014505.1 capsid maturation protease [Mycobacterium phage Blue7]YP_009636532.1 capsin maturation protease [Mycobacterium phage Hammer]YP_010061339.1 capsid maturation protease [Mycobacterium phage Koko]ANT42207.1 capsid maturation protease [Mycobacterium phage ToneTone]ASZ74489.1 capsid maturation protease [Mycobacterium phage Wiks]ATW59709.1 capsid maturat
MTPEEYAAAQAAITAGLANYVQRLASLFTGPVLSVGEWLKLLQSIYPEVQKRYSQSAALGRTFYDSQRSLHHPELPRNERFQSELKWEWFVKNMEPARKELSQADSPPHAPAKLALTAVREVEMGGRRQIIGAVKNDPETRIVQGWARVATGRETCEWCLMLISRGAELNRKGNFAYSSAEAGGLNLDDETAIDLWEEAGMDLEKFRESIKDDIERWHAGCDCLVVPVFDVQNWVGRDAALRAQQLWIEAGKEADELIASGKARSKNTNRETLNALRRRLERGEITIPTYAFAA